MRYAFATLFVIHAMTLGGSLLADETLSVRIDQLVQERLRSMVFFSHGYSDARVREMSAELATVTLPSSDGSVARALGIADPSFFVARRMCGVSLIPEYPSSTLTYEICRLNKDYELLVVRETTFHHHGVSKTTERSAEIRRATESK